MSFYNTYRLDPRKAAAKITGLNAQLITRSPLPRSPDRIDYGLSCNNLYNIVLIMLDSLPDIRGRFFEFSKAPQILSVTAFSESTQWSEAIFTSFWHCNPIRQSIFTSPLLFYIMAYFSDQIKNASTKFVVRLYEIAKQYSIMSLTRIEESVGLGPMAHEQDLLGSRDSQGKEPAPDEATKTQTSRNYLYWVRSASYIKLWYILIIVSDMPKG